MEQTRIRVLLVDGDEDDFVLTKALLQELYGNEAMVDWVSSYPAALDKICANHYVYILVEKLGDGQDFPHFLQQVSAMTPALVYYYSAYDRPEEVEVALQAGAHSFLSKYQMSTQLFKKEFGFWSTAKA